MKTKDIFKITFLLLSIVLLTTDFIAAQNMAEIEGTTEIKMNSTSGEPHLNLIEDDFSTGGSTRIRMTHVLEPSDEFEIRSFLASTSQRLGWHFNGNPRVVYSETNNLLDVSGGGTYTYNSNGVSPVLNLEETGDNDFTRMFFTNSNNSVNKWALTANLGTTAEKTIGFYYDGVPKLVYNEDQGGLGVGTSDPDQLLHLKFSGANGLRVEGDGTGDARGLFLSNTGGAHYIFDDVSDANSLVVQSANDLAFWTNGVNERMLIREAGEVGINGGDNTNRRLGVFTDNDLYGIYADQDGSGTAYGVYSNTESNGAQTKYGVYGTVGGSAGTGNSYGVRGNATTTSTSSWALYASGDMWYTGTLKAPSDERLKKNIQDLEPVLDKVMQLKTKTYEFDRETYDYANLANGPQIGFIAQNVQSLFPTLVEEERHVFETSVNEETGQVIEEEVNILGLSSIEMIPILTKAIQEQQVLIEELKAEVEQLKADK